MKKNILLPVLAIAGGLMLTSCGKDFLDAENKSNIDADKYFSTADGFENLATAPYYKLRAIFDGDQNLFLSGTDLYTEGRSGYASTALSLYKDLSDENSDCQSFYSHCYDGIQQCNTVLNYSNAAGTNVAKRLEEAKALKAFYYYLLSQQFGGVPISDKYIASIQTSFPRASIDSTYQYITGILEEVEKNNILPTDDHTGKVSMRFVYNLLAKTYLAWGWDCGTTADADGSNVKVTNKSYFEKAAAYADKAINGQKPVMTFSNMWNLANEDNNDILFAIKYTRGITGQDETTDGNRQDAYFSNYYNDDSGNGGKGLTKYTNSIYPASERLLYLFEPGDERFEGTFMVEQRMEYKKYYSDNAANDTIYGYYPAWYSDLSETALQNYVNSDATHAQAKVYSSSDPCVFISATVNKRTGKITYKTGTQSYKTSRTTTGTSLCVRKFDDYTATRHGTSKVSFHDIVLAHLTETYLLGAEAYYMAGNESKALEYVNVVRARSGAETLSSFASYKRHYSDGTTNSINTGSGIDNVPYVTNLDPVDVILDERARELCGEFYRWIDLRRTKRLINYNVEYNGLDKNNFVGSDGQYKWYRPFPVGEINLNDALTNEDQNPGYKAD